MAARRLRLQSMQRRWHSKKDDGSGERRKVQVPTLNNASKRTPVFISDLDWLGAKWEEVEEQIPPRILFAFRKSDLGFDELEGLEDYLWVGRNSSLPAGQPAYTTAEEVYYPKLLEKTPKESNNKDGQA